PNDSWPFPSVFSATFLIGDATKPTTLSNLSLDPGAATGSGVYAVYCDHGPNPVPEQPLAPPNTVLDGLTIDAPYEVGIIIGGTVDSPRPPSGCAMQIVRSRLSRTKTGVWSVGDVTNGVMTAVELGDGTEQGKNIFSSMPGSEGAALSVWDGTS